MKGTDFLIAPTTKNCDLMLLAYPIPFLNRQLQAHPDRVACIYLVFIANAWYLDGSGNTTYGTNPTGIVPFHFSRGRDRLGGEAEGLFTALLGLVSISQFSRIYNMRTNNCLQDWSLRT